MHLSSILFHSCNQHVSFIWSQYSLICVINIFLCFIIVIMHRYYSYILHFSLSLRSLYSNVITIITYTLVMCVAAVDSLEKNISYWKASVQRDLGKAAFIMANRMFAEYGFDWKDSLIFRKGTGKGMRECVCGIIYPHITLMNWESTNLSRFQSTLTSPLKKSTLSPQRNLHKTPNLLKNYSKNQQYSTFTNPYQPQQLNPQTDLLLIYPSLPLKSTQNQPPST